MVADFNVIEDYLRNNLSHRQICKKYPELTDPHGWKSHEILKRYHLNTAHRGALYFFNKREVAKIVQSIISTGIAGGDLSRRLPAAIRRYANATIIAKDDQTAYHTLNGELRNLVQSLFYARKKEVKYCKFRNCKNTNLDVAHRHTKDRKRIFFNASNKFKTGTGSDFKYPIAEIITEFLNQHKKNAVIFLCKKHHTEYDLLKTDKIAFLKNVEL